MAHPLLYDVRRVFTSKSVLISMALLIAISLLFINSFAVTTQLPSNGSNVQLLSWYDASGNYHFLAFGTNQFGQPLSGVNLQANLTASAPALYNNGLPVTATASASFPIYKGTVVSTNQSGVAEFSITVPQDKINDINSNYTVQMQVTQSNGYSFTEGGGGLSPYSQYFSRGAFSPPATVPIPPGEVVNAFGNAISSVLDPSNSSVNDVQVIWAGDNGTLPAGYSVYYQFINVTESCTSTPNGGQSCTSSNTGPPPSPNETSMQYLGNMTSFHQIFSSPKLPQNLSSAAEIALGLFYPNGTSTTSSSAIYPTFEFYPQPQTFTPSSTNQNVMQFFLGVFGLFIPLIAIIGSYNSYGKDRVSGVLESVLVQPVSRRGLSLSRFASSFIAMAIAISISMGLVDAIALYFTKSFVSSTIILSSAGAFFVELAAFIGIMMLLARLIKSSGALIGIGIGLFIVFDFFWGIILTLLFALTHTPYDSLAYYEYSVIAEFLNPAQFVGLVDTFLTHQATATGFGGGFNFPISPAQYGITISSIIATGIIWVVVPLAAFLYLAIKKD